MTRIRALRNSINDRFSVLSFSVRADQPLYEIGLATDPALFQRENLGQRTRANFFASTLLGSTAESSGESVYLVPPQVVARFVGQPRLYFGVATFSDRNRSQPINVRMPDRGTMYVDMAGLTERGLRRTARGIGVNGDASGYGVARAALTWGGDRATTNGSAVNGARLPATNGAGNGHVDPAAAAPSGYSDGYSDELWQAPTPAPAPAPPIPAFAADPDATANVPVQSTTQALRNGHTVNGAGYGDRDAYGRANSGGYNGVTAPSRTQSGPADARALRVVSSYYNPSDWVDALRTQVGFFAASVQWWAGVDNTTVAPHSAICQARRVDGSVEGGQHGSAFFIAPNLLLTAAHVVADESELMIVPGKNGAGTASGNEPFGRFRVSATDMVKHPSYVAGNRDFDMALIRVPASNVSPNYFELVEELTQSRPEGVVVAGYAAYSDPQGVIDSVVNATIDADKQHMHGGYIRTLPSDETFDYDLQSLGGTSGSPVYYIEAGETPRTHMVGVHVAGQSDTTNLGCRITPAKLAWIRQQASAWGQTLSFSLGSPRAHAFNAETGAGAGAGVESVASPGHDDVEQYSHVPEPVEEEFAVEQSYRARAGALTVQTPDYPAASRFVPANARNFRAGRRRGAVIDRIVIHITAGGPRIDGTIGWFQNGERINSQTGVQAGPSSAHYIVGRDGEVVQMVRNADTAYHASSANSRSIGIEHNANKPYRLNRRDLPPTQVQYQASAHLVAWLASQYSVPLDRTHIVGHIEATPGDNHDCPSSYWDWDAYMQCVLLAAQALVQNSSTGAAPAASQGVRNRPLAHAQEIITPYYDPSDPATALTCQNNAFSLAAEEWFVGVDSTHAFPHAAICHLQMWDASGNDAGAGSGFYISPNRILTCGHNLVDAASVTITPGLNGAGVKPFGDCTVSASTWRVPQKYRENRSFDNDIAVIDNVPLAAPGGAYFNFMQATPSTHMPLVICGYSAQSHAVPDLTAAIDGSKQHLHGGYARTMQTAETIDYPILSLAGASGSPVYTLSDRGNGLEALVCAVHVSGVRASSGVNTGCFITPAKIDFIENRATTFAYRGAQALSGDGVEHDVRLIPQPDKNACWAASMAMLLGFRGAASVDPEALAREVGGSLSTSYDWNLLSNVSARHGFVALAQPPNASLYHAPTQWAQWLRDHGPLWVVIIGAPHAVVLAGVRGDLSAPALVEVRVLNPWDTRVAFDNDPVAFNPPNQGQDSWIPFEQFAADFGNMAEPDYGNWRVLHLPATVASTATSQSLNARGLRLAAPPRAQSLDVGAATPDASVSIDPSRVPGTRMSTVRGRAGASRWQLDQLEGRKAPGVAMPTGTLAPTEVVIDLGAWPAIEGEAAPLPLMVTFRSHADGAVGDVVIRAGTPAAMTYGVDVLARIDDEADIGGLAAIRVCIDVRFSGLTQGAPAARIDLKLLGDGRYERTNRWLDATQAA